MPWFPFFSSKECKSTIGFVLSLEKKEIPLHVINYSYLSQLHKHGGTVENPTERFMSHVSMKAFPVC